MDDVTVAGVSEEVVLRKYNGDPLPENEFERLTIKDGIVISHDRIDNSEVVAAIEASDIIGKNIGRLIPLEGR